jgi:hypothetical protein
MFAEVFVSLWRCISFRIFIVLDFYKRVMRKVSWLVGWLVSKEFEVFEVFLATLLDVLPWVHQNSPRRVT